MDFPTADPLTIVLSPALPIGAGMIASSSRGAVSRGRDSSFSGGDVHATSTHTLRDSLTVTVDAYGGWTVIAPARAPRIGDRSSALRVIAERVDGATYIVTLEGRAGASYDLRVRGPGVPVVAGAELSSGGAPDAKGYRGVRVTFPADGANADGYVRREVRFTPR